MTTTATPPPVNPAAKPKADKPKGPTQVRIDQAYGTARVGGDARKGERWITGMRKGPGLSGGLTSYRLAEDYIPDLSKVNGSDVTLNLNEASYVTGILTMQSL